MKGGGGIAFALFALHLLDLEPPLGRPRQGAFDLPGAGLVLNTKLFQLLAAEPGEFGLEVFVFLERVRDDGPVFPDLEGLDLQLPLHDEP